MELGDLKKNRPPGYLDDLFACNFRDLGCHLCWRRNYWASRYWSPPSLVLSLGAVSPAVVVPRMIMLIESGYGKAKGIPQMILAGASVDDVYVIVLFTSFMGMYTGSGFRAITLLSVPVFGSRWSARRPTGRLGIGLSLQNIPHPRYDESDAGTERQLPVGDGWRIPWQKIHSVFRLVGSWLSGRSDFIEKTSELAKRLNDKFAKIGLQPKSSYSCWLDQPLIFRPWAVLVSQRLL